MRHGLSARKYILNNKKTVSVLVLALTLSFMTVYVIHAIIATTSLSFRPIFLDLPKRISYAALSGNTVGLDHEDFDDEQEYYDAYNAKMDEISDILKHTDGIDEVWYTQVLSSLYNSVVGEINYEVPLLTPEQIPVYLDHMGATLKEGRLPQNDGEILVQSTLAKNRDYAISGWFMSDWFGETFKIVGIVDCDLPVCVGTPMGYTNSGWDLVVLNDENTTDLVSLLADNGIAVGENDVISDSRSNLDMYEKDVAGIIDTVISVIMAIVMAFLAVAVLVAYISFMRNRVNEYCLYASIGYSKSSIYGMMIREMGIIFGTSIIAGLLLSVIGSALVKLLLLDPMGLIGYIFYPEQIFNMIASYVMILGLLQIPVLITLNSIKTIDAIED